VVVVDRGLCGACLFVHTDRIVATGSVVQ
jgi:hypothetical protein